MVKPLGFLASGNPASTNYASEVLDHAGLFASRIERDKLEAATDEYGIILLAGSLSLSDAEREALLKFVNNGGALIAVGGTSGLDKLFGVETAPPAYPESKTRPVLGEGYIEIRRKKHPITAGMQSSLHTFGGAAVVATEGITLAIMRDSSHQITQNDAIVENLVGKGLAIFIAPDLFSSIARIQQGTYIDQDGIPAPDGGAPINDGILKCEDGGVLSFQWDRTAVDGINPVFYHPIGDELRELVIKSILYAAQRQEQPLAMLWYYPRNLPAIGHISHDSDGNNEEIARELLRVMTDLDIRSTLCVMPDGYPKEFYATWKNAGYEIAMHYDARSGGPLRSWGHEQFRKQHEWLTKDADVKLVSNKNHYTRWEGRLEFFQWAAEAGLQCDQTRGPSKTGTIGYAFGGCHPWFPIDDAGNFIDCMELNLQTQDLVVTSPDYFGRYWVEQAARHHGVAHLLFHPAHITRPGVADALRMVVGYGREHGFEWWTCKQVNDWERARRGVSLEIGERDGKPIHKFVAKSPLKNATLLFLNSGVEGEEVERYGFSFRKVEMDLEGEGQVI